MSDSLTTHLPKDSAIHRQGAQCPIQVSVDVMERDRYFSQLDSECSWSVGHRNRTVSTTREGDRHCAGSGGENESHEVNGNLFKEMSYRRHEKSAQEYRRMDFLDLPMSFRYRNQSANCPRKKISGAERKLGKNRNFPSPAG